MKLTTMDVCRSHKKLLWVFARETGYKREESEANFLVEAGNNQVDYMEHSRRGILGGGTDTAVGGRGIS